MDLARQSIITKDNVSINIDASVYYRVSNARYAYYRVQNFSQAIAEVTYAILKNTCGQFILQDLLEKRQEIADDIEKQV
jgi:erythrocyte band 7 integral membrane protein